MVGYADTKKLITDITGEDVKMNRYRDETMRYERRIRDLLDGTELSSGDCDEIKIEFNNSKTDDLYATCEFIVFHTEDIAMIEWIEVQPSITGNGVARTLRRDMLDEIEDKDVYTNIINESMISVATDQGFKQIQSGCLDGWFVRK